MFWNQNFEPVSSSHFKVKEKRGNMKMSTLLAFSPGYFCYCWQGGSCLHLLTKLFRLMKARQEATISTRMCSIHHFALTLCLCCLAVNIFLDCLTIFKILWFSSWQLSCVVENIHFLHINLFPNMVFFTTVLTCMSHVSHVWIYPGAEKSLSDWTSPVPTWGTAVAWSR